ncbi:MAG: CoA ester lyase [Granulosicoccus sp.]
MKGTFDCRSALFMPATNARAMSKGPDLPADAIIVDLEDSIKPDQKKLARKTAVQALSTQNYDYRIRALRINDVQSPWHVEDILAVAQCHPDVIVLPKVTSAQDIAIFSESLAAHGVAADVRVWAMLESPSAIVNSLEIAKSSEYCGQLSCLLVGNNDIAREAGMPIQSDRTYLVPWLMDVVLAAKSSNLTVLDGVFNDFTNVAGLTAECEQAKSMGMNGKLVIHPCQLAEVNHAFSPSDVEIAAARAIVEQFAMPENEDRGAISIDGRMVERLHLDMATKLLERVRMLATRES